MLSRNKNDSFLAKTVTVIAEGVVIEGKFYSKGSTKVDGTINGEVISEKELNIGKEGKINANVRTTNAIIGGYFQGEMKAAGEVEITSTGKFVGNLIQPNAQLTISKGGLFKGERKISEKQEEFKNFSVKEEIDIPDTDIE